MATAGAAERGAGGPRPSLARVRVIGLTGGIGSGKSAVSHMLAARGATVVDADLVAREVVAPGTPGLAAVVAEFGEHLLLPDGSLDRPALGAVVFADPERLAALNAIVHPLVAERTAELFAQASGDLVVHDVPLLVENGLQDAYEAVVVVAAEPATQRRRLVELRGMTPQEADQRIAAQAPLAAKLAVATHVIRNDGTLQELEEQVERVWCALVGDSKA